MIEGIRSLRPFLGSINYDNSRKFYKTIGFTEVILSDKMCVFSKDLFYFYLQDAYAKDWIENTMVFLEVDDVESAYTELVQLDLLKTFPNAQLKPIVELGWGKEFFLHDPSNILWHIGSFK
ncbi:MAG: glyoxalase [Nonlabens sp.]